MEHHQIKSDRCVFMVDIFDMVVVVIADYVAIVHKLNKVAIVNMVTTVDMLTIVATFRLLVIIFPNIMFYDSSPYSNTMFTCSVCFVPQMRHLCLVNMAATFLY